MKSAFIREVAGKWNIMEHVFCCFPAFFFVCVCHFTCKYLLGHVHILIILQQRQQQRREKKIENVQTCLFSRVSPNKYMIPYRRNGLKMVWRAGEGGCTRYTHSHTHEDTSSGEYIFSAVWWGIGRGGGTAGDIGSTSHWGRSFCSSPPWQGNGEQGCVGHMHACTICTRRT